MAAALHWTQLKTWATRLSPNWIVATFSLLLLAIILAPFVEQRRWPFSTVFHDPPTAEDIAKATAAIRAERDKMQDALAAMTKERDAALRDKQSSAPVGSFFAEAVPHAPPKLGPLSTLRMVDSIAAKGNVLSPSGFIDQKWAIVITFPRENDEISLIVRRIIGGKLTTIPVPSPNPNDLDAPRLTGSTEPGVTLHGSNQLNDRLFHELGACFNVKKTSRSADNLQQWYAKQIPAGFIVDWIDIGPGSPWKEPFHPQCSQ